MFPWVEKELSLDRTYRRGDKGDGVRRIQEWLCLNRVAVTIDGVFGPATEKGVVTYKAQRFPAFGGAVDQVTFDALASPVLAALKPVQAHSASLGEQAVRVAEQHLAVHPREVGGQNRGPWVRIYMEGNEGKEWAWCAGFVCFVISQAAESLGLPMPFRRSFSCDVLAVQARQAGKLVTEDDLRKGKVAKRQMPPGAIILNRRTDNDWVHAGIVTAFHDDHFETIEGNTNDAGEREGYEVCRKIRGYGGRDFVTY